MKRYFNIAGPCFPQEHYMLPPERRLGKVMRFIEEGRWFTLRAGRQTGKTTSAMWLRRHYNAGETVRVINGGGRIDREYGLGRRALDLLVTWKGERHAIETKIRRDTETEADALQQVDDYLDSLGLQEGWLVMFDLRSKLAWTERLWRRTEEVGARRVHVVGC